MLTIKSRMEALAAVSIIVSGCATQPEEIATSYVSPLAYQSYTCNQISMEMQRVTRRATELYGGLKHTADNDAAQMGVGLVLFWPALFFLEGGDDQRAAEYARLKGERDALEQAAIQKDCSITVRPIVPEKPPAKETTTAEIQGAGG